ncbi:MAG TPA: MFS transporter [Candidatus Sulfotelmatobacter sp.]|nr:MFS transporter [Candidatus Sulfotelmatobacter sp.]
MKQIEPIEAQQPRLTFSERIREIREGFERPFWIANISELFERLSYYAVFAVLARYLHENLHFDVERASSLTGMFGGWVWFLAVVGGAIADRLGFRRALSLAYLFLSIAYFSLGSIGSDWFAPIRNAVPLVTLVAFVLMLPALGVALVKPSVVGTTARASKENVRSVGYSIYYTLVNVGSTLGPLLAGWQQEHGSAENVFRIAAMSVFAMLFFVLLLFKEPQRADNAPAATLAQVGKNFLTVISNPRFMIFLLIFTGYWVVFWQEFIALPLFISTYIDPNANTARILAVDPIVVICFTMLIGFLTKRMHAFHAIVLGTLVSSVAWILLIVHPSVWMAVATLVVVAIGEIIQQPRYYDYISRLAPPDQQGTYMGFAFLPLGIGSFVAGKFSGWLMRHYGEELHQPQMVWWWVIGVGVATTILLWIYDRVVRAESVDA